MEFVVGKDYKTRGGWRAKCIWIPGKVEIQMGAHLGVVGGGYFVHFPTPPPGPELNLNNESPPIWHNFDGRAASAFVINEPPAYDGHPADIVGGWEKK